MANIPGDAKGGGKGSGILSTPNMADIPGAREEPSTKLVEGDCEHPVRREKCFFHTIPVVDVNVHIQHPLVIFQQFQDGQDDVVHIAESRCLATHDNTLSAVLHMRKHGTLSFQHHATHVQETCVGVCHGGAQNHVPTAPKTKLLSEYT